MTSKVQKAIKNAALVSTLILVATIHARASDLLLSGGPVIASQPASQTVLPGQTANFQVSASGIPPMMYQWSMNGTPIRGATSSSYTTSAATISNNGEQFTVVVTNLLGKATSNAATLTVSDPILNSSPASLNFGSVNISGGSTQSVTLTNAGNANVDISGVSVSGAGYSASGVSGGLILSPGQSATLAVTFAPAATGSAAGSITVTSNATNSPDDVSLSGAGEQAQYSILLDWNACAAATGYNAYFSTASGGPYTKLTSSPVTSPTFTDSNVTNGQTYYFVVTCIDSSNVESGYSSQVSAMIP